jgi:hypothetical protein
MAVVVGAVVVGCGGLHRRHHPTHTPPHEQWLMRLGAGGVSFIPPCRLFTLPPSFAVCYNVAVNTRNPLCEQWLAVVGVGAVVLSVEGGWSVVVA